MDWNWKWLFFGFSGRINREPYWLAVVIFSMVYFIAVRSDHLNFASTAPGDGPAASLAMLLLVWPSLAISAKRWHDRDKSAWWILIGLIPVVGFFWSLIETGFLAGTRGDNRFGLDPLADDDIDWKD